jgi:hypothetical protein
LKELNSCHLLTSSKLEDLVFSRSRKTPLPMSLPNAKMVIIEEQGVQKLLPVSTREFELKVKKSRWVSYKDPKIYQACLYVIAKANKKTEDENERQA